MLLGECFSHRIQDAVASAAVAVAAAAATTQLSVEILCARLDA